MKNAIHALAVICIFTALSSQAQTTRFDEQTGILEVACVALYHGEQPVLVQGQLQTFAVDLQMVQRQGTEQLDLLALTPVSPDADCSGRFDETTGIYSDIGRLGDEAYNIRLQLGAGDSFTLLEAAHAGAADTSLWRVSKDGNSLFLGGAVHILQAAHFPLPPAFEKAFQAADIMVAEVDFSSSENQDALDGAYDAALRTDGGSLQQDLTPQTYAALQLYLAQANFPLWYLEPLQPAVVQNVLVNLEAQLRGYTEQGADLHYVERAMEENKPLQGLESAQSQIELLNDSFGASTEDLIAGTLALVNSGAIAAELNAMVRAWREARLDFFTYYYIEPMLDETPDYYQALLADRNLSWLPQIEAMLSTAEIELVIVGVLHMVGPHGLLKLLRDNGYSVELYR